MEISCYFAHLQHRNLNKELRHDSRKHSSTSMQQKLLLAWFSYDKFSNLLCISAPTFYLVCLVLAGIMLPSPHVVLDQPKHYYSESQKISHGFKPRLIPVLHTFAIKPPLFVAMLMIPFVTFTLLSAFTHCSSPLCFSDLNLNQPSCLY